MIQDFDILVHADWASRPAGRWFVRAERYGDGWRAAAPALVGPAERLLEREVGPAGLLGVDLPIGAPIHWAQLAGVSDFRDALPLFGDGAWADMLTPAAAPEEIGPRRPFYPARPGGARQAHLLEALGARDMNALRRWCDFNDQGKPAATPLFWTLGAAQVGKGAISFWRETLQPALRAGTARLWPFDGALAALAGHGQPVVAETYPAEVYGWFDLAIRHSGRSKRRQADRLADAPKLLEASARLRVTLEPRALDEVETGFPTGGEDGFDAFVGLLGLVAVVSGERPEHTPDDARVAKVEGWILGRRPGPMPYGPETG